MKKDFYTIAGTALVTAVIILGTVYITRPEMYTGEMGREMATVQYEPNWDILDADLATSLTQCKSTLGNIFPTTLHVTTGEMYDYILGLDPAALAAILNSQSNIGLKQYQNCMDTLGSVSAWIPS